MYERGLPRKLTLSVRYLRIAGLYLPQPILTLLQMSRRDPRNHLVPSIDMNNPLIPFFQCGVGWVWFFTRNRDDPS